MGAFDWLKNKFAKKPKEPKYARSAFTGKSGPTSKIYTSANRSNLEKFLARIKADYDVISQRQALIRKQWAKRPKVLVGELVRVTAGGRHAYYQSNVGIVRKPYVQ